MKQMALSFILTSALALLSAAAPADQTLTPSANKPLAHNFELVDQDGARHKLSDFRGKPVIVNFWATWCPPCRKELPSMNRAWQQLKNQGVQMIAVDVGEDEDTIFGFLSDYPIDFLVLLDIDGSEVTRWPVKGVPTTFVLDPKGRIVYTAIGGREWDDPALLEKILTLRTGGTSAAQKH